jgi:hypothetical protein
MSLLFAMQERVALALVKAHCRLLQQFSRFVVNSYQQIRYTERDSLFQMD